MQPRAWNQTKQDTKTQAPVGEDDNYTKQNTKWTSMLKFWANYWLLKPSGLWMQFDSQSRMKTII